MCVYVLIQIFVWLLYYVHFAGTFRKLLSDLKVGDHDPPHSLPTEDFVGHVLGKRERGEKESGRETKE